MALLNRGKVMELPSSQVEKVLKGHHTKYSPPFQSLCVGNNVLLARAENGMATSPFLGLSRCLHITCCEYRQETLLRCLQADFHYSMQLLNSGILQLRIDPSVSVVLDFPSDVVLKTTSKSLQESCISNHSSWMLSRQNGRSCSELSPPAFHQRAVDPSWFTLRLNYGVGTSLFSIIKSFHQTSPWGVPAQINNGHFRHNPHVALVGSEQDVKLLLWTAGKAAASLSLVLLHSDSCPLRFPWKREFQLSRREGTLTTTEQQLRAIIFNLIISFEIGCLHWRTHSSLQTIPIWLWRVNKIITAGAVYNPLFKMVIIADLGLVLL